MTDKPDEPKEYKKGKFNFYGKEFFINPHSYITVPESRHFIDVAKEYIEQNDITTIVDVGIGSGTVALTLKRLFPYIRVIGIDICPKTLEVAKQNRILHGLDIDLIQGSYFDNFNMNLDQNKTLVTAILPHGNKDYLIGSNIERHKTGQFEFYPQISLFPDDDPYDEKPLNCYVNLIKSMIKNNYVYPIVSETGVVEDEIINEAFKEFKRFTQNIFRFEENYSVTLLDLVGN